MPPPDSSADTPDLCTAVRSALRQWQKIEFEADELAAFHLFWQARRTLNGAQGLTAPAARKMIEDALTRLQEQHPDEAQLLRMRYVENRGVTYAAHQRNVAESTIYVLQRAAIAKLCSVMHAMEAELVAQKQAQLDDRLGAPVYLEAIGLEEAVTGLADIIERADAPWLVALEGIGGIGKTTLADVLTRRLALQPRFAGAAWVSAQQSLLTLEGALRQRANPARTTEAVMAALYDQIMPSVVAPYAVNPAAAQRALRQHLTRYPHLIVIDNLETIEDVDALAPLLNELANPSNILMATRKRYTGTYSIYHFAVPELSERHALTLVRREAQHVNLTQIEAADDDELRPIYATVCGNPLALRLVVGQLHQYGLAEVLDDLRQARGQSIENLYTFIYRRAWDCLSERERHVLLAMPLTPAAGEDATFIEEISGLPHDELHAGLQRLVQLNLVSVAGGLQRRRYAIHSLTRTFLQEQVARWA